MPQVWGPCALNFFIRFPKWRLFHYFQNTFIEKNFVYFKILSVLIIIIIIIEYITFIKSSMSSPIVSATLTHKLLLQIAVQLRKLPIPPRTQVPPRHIYIKRYIAFSTPLIIVVIRDADRQRPLLTVIVVHLAVVGWFQPLSLLKWPVLMVKDVLTVSDSYRRFTCCVTEMTVRVRTSPPDLIRSTTCLCVAPSTFTPFLQRKRENVECPQILYLSSLQNIRIMKGLKIWWWSLETVS